MWPSLWQCSGSSGSRATWPRDGNAPKTPKGRRRIALSTTAQKALKRQRQRRLQAEARLRAGPAWTDYGLVFTDEFGEPLTGSRITERRLRPLLRREGLPPLRFHDLRHTAATLMLTAGVNPKVVSEMLGHTSVAITPRPLLARHADHAGRGGSPARRRADRTFEGTNEGTADSAATKKPRFALRIGARDECWYRISRSVYRWLGVGG